MKLLPLRMDLLGQLVLPWVEQAAGCGRRMGDGAGNTLLFEPLIQLLLVVLQVHDALLGQLQVTLQLTLGSLQVHSHLFLLLQGSLQLMKRRTSVIC